MAPSSLDMMTFTTPPSESKRIANLPMGLSSSLSAVSLSGSFSGSASWAVVSSVPAFPGSSEGSASLEPVAGPSTASSSLCPSSVSASSAPEPSAGASSVTALSCTSPGSVSAAVSATALTEVSASTGSAAMTAPGSTEERTVVAASMTASILPFDLFISYSFTKMVWFCMLTGMPAVLSMTSGAGRSPVVFACFPVAK